MQLDASLANQLTGFDSWLVKHKLLVGELTIDNAAAREIPLKLLQSDHGEAAVMGHIIPQLVPPAQLQPTTTTSSLLTALTRCKLSSLVLNLGKDSGAASLYGIASSLQQLTGLQSLAVTAPPGVFPLGTIDVLVPHLAQLTQLTSVALGPLSRATPLDLLPVSLARRHIELHDPWSQGLGLISFSGGGQGDMDMD